MPITTIAYKLQSTSRVDMRKELLDIFSDECPGTGTGDLCSKYHYVVEKYADAKEYNIVLRRPAPLNKGLDFIVYIDGLFFKKNRRYSSPGHSDIVNVLLQVQQQVTSEKYSLIKSELMKIFECQECSLTVVSDVYFKDFEGNSHPIAAILLAAKWLFIEQDMTYWNWSGRNMLWNALKEAGLV